MDESATPLTELPRKKVTVTSIKELQFKKSSYNYIRSG